MHPDLTEGILWYIVFLYSTTCHEAAHAWAALRQGDDTAAQGGQVSLNPWPHLRREPIGMCLVPIVSFLAGGWILGWASAPYNREWARTYPRRAGLMALAGPCANAGLVLASALLLRMGLAWHAFILPDYLTPSHIALGAGDLSSFAAHLLSIIFSLNLLLAVFNLLPIPPLDGSSIPLIFLPDRAAAGYASIMRSPVLRLVGFLIIFRSSSHWFGPLLLKAAALIPLAGQLPASP